tara:strand:- start:986 stop:2380 length:1395 start_codon:yes stop_codon:yes gene_type:complete
MNRTFNYKDQEIFSKLSQDFNPIHLDESWAEKEYPGKIVIYGVSILLWAIESIPHVGQIIRIKARFLHPVYLNESISLKFKNDNKKKILSIFIRKNLVAKFELFYGEKSLPSKISRIEKNKFLKYPRELSLSEIYKEKGVVDISANKFRNLESFYPVSTKYIGILGIKGLLSISRLIGMYCPGLRSIFEGLDIYLEPNQNHLTYKVTKTNPLLGFVRIKVNGLNLNGEVRTYFKEGQKRKFKKVDVKSQDFSNSIALVVGGSGLGKTAAKIVLENSGEVLLTSRQNNKDYFKENIELFNQSNLKYYQLDITDEESIKKFICNLNIKIKSIYYFASPRIFRRRLNKISNEDMNDFLNIYVYKFLDFIEKMLNSQKCSENLIVGYPSSVAVSEKSPDQFEYYSSKKLGEYACYFLEKKYKNLKIEIERLPRLNTRQTNSFIKVKTFENDEFIRKFVNNVEKSVKNK